MNQRQFVRYVDTLVDEKVRLDEGVTVDDFVMSFIESIQDQLENKNFEKELKQLITEAENPELAKKIRLEREQKEKEEKEQAAEAQSKQ